MRLQLSKGRTDVLDEVDCVRIRAKIAPYFYPKHPSFGKWLRLRMASVAENVTARALGLKPQLRVIEGG